MILAHPLQSYPTSEKRREITQRSSKNDIYRVNYIAPAPSTIKPILSCRTNKNNIGNKKYLLSSPIHCGRKSELYPRMLSPVSMDVSTNTKGPMKGMCKTRRYVSNCTQTSEIEFEPIDLSVNTSKQNRKSKSDDNDADKTNRKSVLSEEGDEYSNITPMHQLKLNKKENNQNDMMRRRRRKRRNRRNKRGSGYLLRNAINNRYMKLQKNKDGQFVDENGKVVEGIKEGEDGRILVEKVGEDGKVYYEAEGFEYEEEEDEDDDRGEEEDDDDFEGNDEFNKEGNEDDKKIETEVKKCIDSMIDIIEKESKNTISNSLESRARNSIAHLNFNYLEKLKIISETDSPFANSPLLSPNNGTESDTDKKDRTEKCNKILADPILRAFFKAYLTKNFQSESILFWEAIFELEDIEEKITSVERVKYIKEVYDLFIEEGSKMEINIEHDLRKKIEEKVNDKTDKVSVYSDAKNEIARLIITNNYENFKKTDLYKQAGAIEKWFSVYSKFDPDLKKAIAEQMSLVRQTVYVGEYFPPPKEVVEQDSVLRRLIRELLDFFQHLFGK